MVYYFIATPDCGPSFTYCPRVRPPFAAFFYLRLTQRRENRLLTLDRLCLQYSISIWYRVMPTLFLQLMHKLFGIWHRLTPVASLPTKQANKISIEPCSFPYYDGFFFLSFYAFGENPLELGCRVVRDVHTKRMIRFPD